MKLFNTLFLQKQEKKSLGFCGVEINQSGLALVHGDLKTREPSLHSCFFQACGEDISIRQDRLRSLVQEQGLDGVDCSWVLSPHYYKLLLMEAPNIPNDELAGAARWKVKDYIDFPLEDALIDAFRIPDYGVGGSHKMMYVVAARLSEIKPIVELIQHSGLNLTTIDIHELALRNITTHFPENERGIALVHLSPEHCGILLGHHGNIFLARTLKFNGFDEGEDLDDSLERLVLEIQRSYDYYYSQLSQPEPSKLYLTPMIELEQDVISALQEKLAVDVVPLDMNTVLKTTQDLDPAQQAQCIGAMGGVLRRVVGI